MDLMVSAISGSITQRFIVFGVVSVAEIFVLSTAFTASRNAVAAEVTSQPRQPAPMSGAFVVVEGGELLSAQDITRRRWFGGEEEGGTARWIR